MGVNYSPKIVSNGLVLHLDAANAKSYPGSGATWTDLSGNANNGTLVNGPTFSADNKGLIVFDGTNDRVECPAFNVNYVTLTVWVYKTSSNTNQGICRKQNNWALSQYNGTLQIAPGTNWAFSNTGYIIPLNTWINIAYVYSGTGVSGSQIVYVNGSSIFSNASGVGSLPSNVNPVRIGFDDNNWWWGGKIAQTMIYNRALSAVEIAQNFNAQRGRYGI